MSDIEGKEFVLAGVIMKRLLSGEQTAGQFCLFENKSNGHTRTPIHVHAKDDETIYIIGGELTAVIDGQGSTPHCRREHLPAAWHSAPAYEYERQAWQIHLDRDPRSLRPVS